MHGIIMAGGFGTRLHPLTYGLPKPMVPILNRPIMYYVITQLRSAGIKKMTSLLYFEPEIISNYFGDGKKLGIKMSYVTSPDDYGTAGAVKYATHKLNINQLVVVISGDVLTDIDLANAIEEHKQSGCPITIVLTRVENPLSYGIVIVNKEGRVEKFMEKPTWGQVFSDMVNSGIYIIEPEMLDYIPLQQTFDFSRELFPLLIKKGISINSYIAKGYWRDVGTLFDYREACFDALQGRVNLNHNFQAVSYTHLTLPTN